MKLKFLGTGASDGTWGSGRSKRLESSLYLKDKTSVLIDVTSQFKKQCKTILALVNFLYNKEG